MCIHVADTLVCNLLFWLTNASRAGQHRCSKKVPCTYSFKEMWPSSSRQDAISFVTPGLRGFH